MSVPSFQELRSYLDALVERYEEPSFIAEDPLGVPHGFDDPRDQAVIGLYAALLAWGRRSTVINKMEALCERMNYQPHAFVAGFDPARDADALDGFKHRTFQPVDALWFTRNLSDAMERHGSIENIFADHLPDDPSHPYPMGPAIQGFSTTLLTINPGTPQRLRKHLARPEAKSACKRLNMYLRWMVRPGPVDLGLWTRIRPEQLMVPLDVHVGRQARALGFIERKSNDWKAVRILTDACRRLCAEDPARYDFAFFPPGAQDEPLDEAFTDDNALPPSSWPTA